MDETVALEVTAVRAVETGDSGRAVWSDADREWASRVAAETVGEGADAETFLARRAGVALERLATYEPAVGRAVRALRWSPWIGPAAVAGAFVLGVAVDRLGGATHINLLAPPVFVLLLWNVLVYVTLVVRLVAGRSGSEWTGPVRALVLRVAGGRRARRRAERDGAERDGAAALRASLAALSADWARRAAPLYSARTARILHLAAAATAAGVIAGLYVRGLAFEYRATWESTFLDADQVRALLAAALAPGSLLTGIAVPALDAVAAIRAPASENAATWLHLLAGSVAAVIVIPRLLLALGAGLVERRRATHVVLPLGERYFQRLLRGYHAGPVRLRVVPYSYALAAPALAGLEAVAARVFGAGVSLAVEPSMAWGDDDALAARPLPDPEETVVAVFNLTATPEREAHGAFLAALSARAGPVRPVVAVVDESTFRARWPGEEARLAERRAAWSELFAGERVVPFFVDLASPDLAAAEAALDLALAEGEARGTSGG